MIGWLIYQQQDAEMNQSYIQWFLYEANKQQIDMKFLYREAISIGIVDGICHVLVDGQAVDIPDFVVNRSIEPLLQEFFSAQSVPIFNDAKTATIANHKGKTHLAMHELGIPMMPTFYMNGRALPANPPIEYPVIVKPATGRGGQDVHLLTHESDWENFRQMATHTDYIIQSTDVQLGKDVRVFVIGKEIIAAVLRSNPTDFRANYKLGGNATRYPLSNTEKGMIERICHQFDFGLVGIDFLIDHTDNLIFNEIEDVVGSRILSEVTNINLLEKYISFIIDKVYKKGK